MQTIDNSELIKSDLRGADHPELKKGGGTFTTFVQSTFIWIVGLFVIANSLWGLLHPLENVPHTSQPNLELSKSALRFKMSELQAGARPDVLLIGSSLPMCAFFYTERPPFFDLSEGAKIRSLKLNLLQAYPEAGYFTAKLKDVLGKKLDVFNFAGAACMVSDTRLVLDGCLAAHKKPGVIIYGVGLRDFVDNINPPPGETPYYKALCTTSFLAAHLPQMMQFPAFSDLTICALCKMYDLRNEFRITAEHVACQMLHHPSTLQLAFMLGDLNKAKLAVKATGDNRKAVMSSAQASDAVHRQPGDVPKSGIGSNKSSNRSDQTIARTVTAANENYTSGPKLAVLDYPQRYAPANYKRLQAEMQELKSLISFCKKQGIKIVIVNMPVSEGHKVLAPPGLRERYLHDLRAVGEGATMFVDYENVPFADADFFDTVHLNAIGSVKFVDDITNKLKSSGVMQ